MSETQEQIAFINWVALQHPKLLKYMIHIPNQRKCSKIYGSLLKKMGLRPGASDLFFAYPTKKYHGLFIEMKTDKGFPTKLQIDFLKTMNEVGYYSVICHGWEEAKLILTSYLKA